MSKAEWSCSLKIALIMASRMLGLFMLFPVFSIYAQNYQTTPIFIGLAIGIYGLTQALLQIPFGYLSDQYGRKPLLIIGLSLFLIGSLMAANAQDIMDIIVARTVQGSGAVSAVLMAFLSDVVRAEKRAYANALIGIQIGLAFILAIVIAPSITHYFDLSGLFLLMALLALLALLIAIILPNTSVQKQYQFSRAQLHNLFSPVLLRLDISIYLLHLILSATFIVLPLILFDRLNISLSDNWQFYLPVMLVSFLLMLPFIVLFSKYKKTSLVFTIAIFGLAISQFLLYQLPSKIYIVFILMSIFFTFFNILEAILPSLVAKIAPQEKKGVAMGIFSTAQFLGIFSGAALGGFLYDLLALKTVFLCLAVIAVFWGIYILNLAKIMQYLSYQYGKKRNSVND